MQSKSLCSFHDIFSCPFIRRVLVLWPMVCLCNLMLSCMIHFVHVCHEVGKEEHGRKEKREQMVHLCFFLT